MPDKPSPTSPEEAEFTKITRDNTVWMVRRVMNVGASIGARQVKQPTAQSERSNDGGAELYFLIKQLRQQTAALLLFIQPDGELCEAGGVKREDVESILDSVMDTAERARKFLKSSKAA